MSKHQENQTEIGSTVTAPLASVPDAESQLVALAKKFDEQDIAALAYELWQARGCPIGSPEEDWFGAVEQLQSRN